MKKKKSVLKSYIISNLYVYHDLSKLSKSNSLTL